MKIKLSIIKKCNNIIFREYGIYSSYATLAKIEYNPLYNTNKKLIQAVNIIFYYINKIKY